jgi:hypothetical protein
VLPLGDMLVLERVRQAPSRTRTASVDGMEQAVQVAGALLILLAFAAAQFDKLDVESKPYLWLNLVGGTVLAALAWHERQYGFLLLESVWAAVSLYSLLRGSRGQRAPAL